MYIEASDMVYGQRAYLISKSLRGVSGKQCLTFFYSMYGAGTGLLSVYLKKEGDEDEIPLWRRTGEQSISWLRGLIEYESDRNYQVRKKTQPHPTQHTKENQPNKKQSKQNIELNYVLKSKF